MHSRRLAPCPLLPLIALTTALAACRADVWLEDPDQFAAVAADTASRRSVVPDTIYRRLPIDSIGATFAWLAARPAALMADARTFPSDARRAVEQFLRALGQTGSSAAGQIGVGRQGYERAFTYVHPAVRRRHRSYERWSEELAGIVRLAAVRVEDIPDEQGEVFAEVLALREFEGQSQLGLYYGHFRAARGDNGWQVTAARLASEDWAARLAGNQSWRFDRAGAARAYALDDPAYAVNLVRLYSGEWVPRSKPVERNDLPLGLPDLP